MAKKTGGFWRLLFGEKQVTAKQTHTGAVSTPTVITKPKKMPIRAENLSYESAMARYLCRAHYKSPSQYDYLEYHRAEFDCILNNIEKTEITLHNEKVLRNKEIMTPYEKTATITKKTRIERFCNFVALDVETTGLKVGGNDIIEISAIKFENYIPVSQFTTLLKPRNPIPPSASDINGITDSMVENSPKFAQIKRALQEYIAGYPIVAHNASFDIKFLFVSGLDFPERTIFYDTLELSRRHIKDYDGDKLDSYKLVDVCEECCIYFDGAHRASADALATGLLFIEIIRKIREADSVLDI